MGRHGLGVTSLARLGQHHVNAAPVHVTAAPFDQAVPGQPVDQARQRALAQVDGLGQVLGTEVVAEVATVPGFAKDSTAA